MNKLLSYFKDDKTIQGITICNFLIPFIIKFFFEENYIYIFSSFWGYSGSYVDINTDKCFISWVAFFLFCILVSSFKDIRIKAYYYLFFILSIIPTISMFWLKNLDSIAFFAILLYWTIFWISLKIGEKSKYRELYFFHNEPKDAAEIKIANVFFVLSLLGMLFFSGIYGNFRFFVSFDDVYTYRLIKENQMSGIIAYIFLAITNIMLPYSIAIFLMYKKYIRAFIGMVLMMMAYSIYGNKTIFFTVITVMAIRFVCTQKLEKNTHVLVGLTLAVLLPISLCSNRINLLSALLDRLFQIPASAHYYYYDFFQTGDYLYLRESILRFFFDSPYSELSSMLIGTDSRYFIDSEYNNLNNGLFSIAYANFGLVGVVLQPILISILIVFWVKMIRYSNIIVFYLFMISNVIFLMSTGATTWLVSGGYVFQIVILFVLKYYYNTGLKTNYIRRRIR